MSASALSQGLYEELHTVVHKYDDSILLSSVVGVLELLKAQLIYDAVHEKENDDDTGG